MENAMETKPGLWGGQTARLPRLSPGGVDAAQGPPLLQGAREWFVFHVREGERPSLLRFSLQDRDS